MRHAERHISSFQLTRRDIPVSILRGIVRLTRLRYGQVGILAVHLLILRQQRTRRQSIAQQQQRLREQGATLHRLPIA